MTGALGSEAALVARRVRAAHQAAGQPDLPELAALWSECSRALLTNGQAGDVVAARAALADYEAAALEAVRKAVAGV